MTMCKLKNYRVPIIIYLCIQALICNGQSFPKDSIVDFGFGLIDLVPVDSIQSMAKNNVFVINNMYENKIVFTKIKYIDKIKYIYNNTFYYDCKTNIIKVYNNKIKKIFKLREGIEFNNCYSFSFNNDSYLYFTFNNVNIYGDVGKLYSGYLIKNKTNLIPLPDKITSNNPNLLFSIAYNYDSLSYKLNFLDVKLGYNDTVKVYTLYGNNFKLNKNYYIIVSTSNDDAYPYVVMPEFSRWINDRNKKGEEGE